MNTKVAIRGAEFFAFHGFYEEERKSGNKFIIDAEVSLRTFDSNDDNINDTVNYEQLYGVCHQEMQKTQKLLETVVFNILTRIKNEHPNVLGARVKMEKLGPQLGGKVDKAVVEMEY